MAFYMTEEHVYKCHKHPSKRRKTGICPKCLRDRLATLCPDCARPRPCPCGPAPPDSSTSSSSSSTSFSLFSFSRGGSRHVINGSNNPELDPTLRKSRSVAPSFLRSRILNIGTETETETGGSCDVEKDVKNSKGLPPKVGGRRSKLWSMFMGDKSKKDGVDDDDDDNNGMGEDLNICGEGSGGDACSMMMRSRSVAVGGGNRVTPASSKKGWYFPSPINGFRYSKSTRSVPVT